jgi:hypothetical protein
VCSLLPRRPVGKNRPYYTIYIILCGSFGDVMESCGQCKFIDRPLPTTTVHRATGRERQIYTYIYRWTTGSNSRLRKSRGQFVTRPSYTMLHPHAALQHQVVADPRLKPLYIEGGPLCVHVRYPTIIFYCLNSPQRVSLLDRHSFSIPCIWQALKDQDPGTCLHGVVPPL